MSLEVRRFVTLCVPIFSLIQIQHRLAIWHWHWSSRHKSDKITHGLERRILNWRAVHVRNARTITSGLIWLPTKLIAQPWHRGHRGNRVNRHLHEDLKNHFRGFFHFPLQSFNLLSKPDSISPERAYSLSAYSALHPSSLNPPPPNFIRLYFPPFSHAFKTSPSVLFTHQDKSFSYI